MTAKLTKIKWVEKLNRLLISVKYGNFEQRSRAVRLLKEMARIADKKTKRKL
jgi:hypothetical protein